MALNCNLAVEFNGLVSKRAGNFAGPFAFSELIQQIILQHSQILLLNIVLIEKFLILNRLPFTKQSNSFVLST